MARPRSLRRFLQDLRANAFLDGYHAGLAVTIVLIAAGVVISYLALRRLPEPAASPALVPGAPDTESGQASGPELAGTRS